MHPNNGVLGAVALRHGTDLLGVTSSADDRRHHERLRRGQGKVSRVLYLLALLVVVNIREHQHERRTEYGALIKKLTNLFLRAGEIGGRGLHDQVRVSVFHLALLYKISKQ
jgi:hypothetical protein